MVQERYNPKRQFLGPFRGLNTLLDGSQLPPEFAAVAHNVLAVEGRLRPRDPWVPVKITDQSGGSAFAMNVGGRVMSMRFWKPTATSVPRLILKNADFFVGGTGYVTEWAIGAAPAGVFRGASRLPADFVQYGDSLYCLDGSARIVRAGGGMPLRFAGIMPPNTRAPGEVTFSGVVPLPGGAINSTVSYAVTYSRGPNGFNGSIEVESNPVYSPTFTPGAGQGVRISFGPALGLAEELVDTISIYRRNHSLNHTAWRLLTTLEAGRMVSTVFDDPSAESVITRSSDVTGPFAPYRNHPLSFARMGAIYRGRLFVDDYTHPGRVRFSEVGYPDYVHPDDWLSFAGDQEDRITGLIAVGDQLYVGKPNGIHAHSGTLARPTNLTVATGAEALDSNDQQQRTRARTGPENLTNGFVLAGEPTGIFYARRDGLYQFDGLEDRVISDAVRPTWAELARDIPDLENNPQGVVYTFAVDPAEQMLYICANAASIVGASPSTIDRVLMAYNWRERAFTTLDDGGALIGDVQPVGSLSCVGVSLGGPTGTAPTTPLAIGTSAGWVLAAEPRPTVEMGAFVPYFEWRTGEFAVARGMRAHLYHAKFFLARRLSEGLGGGDFPEVELAAILNLDELPDNPLPGRLGRPKRDQVPSPSDAIGARVFRTIDLRHRDSVLLKVGGTGQDVTLIFRKAPTWRQGVYPGLGLIGWELDAELVGQR